MNIEKKDKSVPTIYDIARAAGVSPGTVSRTLNNVGYIKDETRQKIEQVMKDLNYIPNRAARTLKTKKTGLIFLAIPDTDNPFYVDMIKSVQDVVKYND
ncbi:MAG: LacI family DNA-binding transcriptional regulator, partial [Thermoplasmata archaeon]